MKPIIKTMLLASICVFISSCISSSYTQLPSVNYSFRVKSLVMHFTAINYQKSVDALVKEGWVSSHYLVPESNDPSYPYDDLRILQLVDENERAWHAGVSYWQGRTGLNDSSIGIEIVNVPSCFQNQKALEEAGTAAKAEHGPNRLCVFPDYDPKQIELVIELSKDILSRNPDIDATAVVGHSDIAPSRKNDPGPRFPWFQLYEAGIGAWYEQDVLAKYWQAFNANMPNIALVQAALRAYGYGIIETGINDQQSIDTVSAFQMHFLPWQVSGNIDSSTAAAIFALLERYFPERLEKLTERYEIESQPRPDSEPQITKGQIHQVFPLTRSNTRAFVNNRASFKAYSGRGSMIVNAMDAESADIFINDQALNITLPFEPSRLYEYSLAKRTKDGLNSIRVENIEPQGASLEIHIPYPDIKNLNRNYKNLGRSNNASASGKLNIDDAAYDFSAVDTLIQQDVIEGFPGAVLLVMHKGEIVKFDAYGYAQKYSSDGMLLQQPDMMTVDTHFDLASNTKTFATTLAIMHLVTQGKVHLDAPISNYLPEYLGEGREARSVSDLLAHASGYDADLRFFDQNNEDFHSLNRSTTKDLLLSQVPFKTGRQSEQHYSDINFMVLGLLIERVVGMALDEYLETQIYQALDLDSLRFNPLQKGASKRQFAATEIQGNTRQGRIQFEGAREHVLRGEVHDEKAFYSMGGVAGHAGLFGTAKDLAVLAQLVLNGGGYDDAQLFDEATLARFTSPRYGSDGFGLGWRLAADPAMAWHFGPYASTRAFGHTGWTGTATIMDPEYDLAIILLTNKKHSKVIDKNGEPYFEGDSYETGRYGSVMSLVYEAIIAGEASN
ncbi:penicillin binding protein PBP4B [Ningiella sp. W23]|uniref:penicillin binding protein PBP4B n=1 Tax=Ningiella sp. W23 TaxID=3023715 RepID=UPI0037573EA0